MHADPADFDRDRWKWVLDSYELEFAPHGGYFMWMVDFVRAVRTCRGHDRLLPALSHGRLFIQSLADGPIPPGAPSVVVYADPSNRFTLEQTFANGHWEVVTRRSVRAAVKTFRVMVRRLGVRLGPPHRERPPADVLRLVWVAFRGGRLG